MLSFLSSSIFFFNRNVSPFPLKTKHVNIVCFACDLLNHCGYFKHELRSVCLQYNVWMRRRVRRCKRGKKNRGPSLLTSQNGAHLTRIFGTNCTTWLVYTISPYNHGKTLTNTTLLCLNPKHKHRFGKQWVVWMQHIAIGEMKKTWKLFLFCLDIASEFHAKKE